MLGPKVGASHQVQVPILVSLHEEEAFACGLQIVEELLCIESDAESNWSQTLVLWPFVTLRIKGRLAPKDHRLLLGFLDC